MDIMSDSERFAELRKQIAESTNTLWNMLPDKEKDLFEKDFPEDYKEMMIMLEEYK
jgi:hypothetical protein